MDKDPRQGSTEKEKQAKARKADEKLDEGLKESFPASDPPAVSQTTRTGEPGENRKRDK